jgi:hypothetical protein
MEYFRLRQDPEYRDAPVPGDVFKQIDWRQLTGKEAHKIADITIFRLSGKEAPDFIDLLDRQLFMVSPVLKGVLQLYVPNLTFKRVLLTNAGQKCQKLYYLPLFEPVDCLSDASIQTPDKRMVKHLVLDGKTIGNAAVFRVRHGYETMMIARLDAAESILRRNLRGIFLQAVAVK